MKGREKNRRKRKRKRREYVRWRGGRERASKTMGKKSYGWIWRGPESQLLIASTSTIMSVVVLRTKCTQSIQRALLVNSMSSIFCISSMYYYYCYVLPVRSTHNWYEKSG